MIKYAPELAPMPTASRDVLREFLRSVALGGMPAKLANEVPVARFVRMPHYVQVGFETEDGATIQMGRADSDRMDKKSARRREPEDVARRHLDAFAFELRDALAEGERILAAIEILPAGERAAWQDEVARDLREVLPRLEALAYEGADGIRAEVPGGKERPTAG